LNQGEIWLTDLEPVKGSEQGKVRPVVIISGDTLNTNLPIVIVCPLSSVIKNFETCVVINKSSENGLSSDSEIISFQMRSVSKQRLIRKLGNITNSELNQVIEGINDVLRY
jgi:mRNA interferase MazF